MSDKSKDEVEKTVVFDPNEPTIRVSADYFAVEPTVIDPSARAPGQGAPAAPQAEAFVRLLEQAAEVRAERATDGWVRLHAATP